MQNYKYVHILGIGGSAMSALANFFLWQNKIVSGYDLVYNESIKSLENKGVSFSAQDSIQTIPKYIIECKKETLILYTPALGNNNPERNKQFKFFKENSYTIVKRHHIYKFYTQKHRTIAIAGSHGKTSTTSILGHILINSNIPCVLLSGGILNNYKNNFVTNCSSIDDYTIVVETDEYDNFFSNVYYDFAIVTSISPDHLDYYLTFEKLKSAFRDFIYKNKKNNALVLLHNSIKDQFICDDSTIIYGINTEFLNKDNISIKNDVFRFSCLYNEKLYKDILSPIAGLHQVENTLATVLVSLKLGLGIDDVKNSLENFKGIKRRFNILFKSEKFTVIDDFAHHPQEIAQLIKTLDLLYKEKKKLIIFQPHSYSRTKLLLNEFSEVLSKVDSIIIMDIFPAREDDIYGISAMDLFSLLTNKMKKILSTDIIETLESVPQHDIIAIVGAGDISNKISNKILQWVSGYS